MKEIHKHKIEKYIIIQCIVGLIIVVIENFWLNRQMNVCIMDGVALLMNGAVFLVLYIVYLIYFVGLMGNFFDVQIVLRNKSRKSIWMQHVKKVIEVNAVTAFIWVLVGFVSGKIHSTDLLNWSEAGSFYSYTTGMPESICELNAVSIIFVAYFTIMLSLNILSCIVLLGYWLFDNVFFSMIIILATGFYDSWIAKNSLFLKRLLIYGDVWADTKWIAGNVLSLMIIACTIFYIGLKLADRKEFI